MDGVLSDGTFDLVATNEYGEYDRRALALYALDMVIEVLQHAPRARLPRNLTTVCSTRGASAVVPVVLRLGAKERLGCYNR